MKWLVASFVLLGCSGGAETASQSEAGAPGSSPAPACEAGRAAECPCGGGQVGVQICADDGSKWGKCGCVSAQSNGGSPTVTGGLHAKDVCKQSTDDSLVKFCHTLAGPNSIPFAECSVPIDTEILSCTPVVNGGTCCFQI